MSIEAYLEDVDEPKRAELERIRGIIKQTVPDAEETISYGMPAFKYKGQPLMYYAAFKDHLSIFPTSEPIEALKEKLSGYTISKGTIQFTLDNPIPEETIKALLYYRMKQIDS